MKKLLLAALAAMMLSGCEAAMLFCDEDFDCSGDFHAAPKPLTPPPAH